jgi:hypothetical protein
VPSLGSPGKSKGMRVHRSGLALGALLQQSSRRQEPASTMSAADQAAQLPRRIIKASAAGLPAPPGEDAFTGGWAKGLPARCGCLPSSSPQFSFAHQQQACPHVLPAPENFAPTRNPSSRRRRRNACSRSQVRAKIDQPLALFPARGSSEGIPYIPPSLLQLLESVHRPRRTTCATLMS